MAQACGDAVIEKPEKMLLCQKNILKLEALMQHLISWIDEIPPINQPMRFGNKAFRIWHTSSKRYAIGLTKS